MARDATKPKGTWGGRQPGAGRPKGKKNKATLEREAVQRIVQQKLLRAAEKIISAQIGLGIGSQYLMRIDKEYVQTGKGKGFWRNKKPVIVNKLEEIEEFLEGAIKNGDAADESEGGAAYYFLTAKDPENGAIDSMLNRAIGKVKDAVEHSGTIGFSLKQLAEEAENIDKTPKTLKNKGQN